jgi:hypothetical protein
MVYVYLYRMTSATNYSIELEGKKVSSINEVFFGIFFSSFLIKTEVKETDVFCLGNYRYI